MKRLLVAAIAIAAVFAGGANIANAAPVTGSINLVGDFKPTIGGVATQNMALATGIDFNPFGGGTGSFQTLTGTDDLAAYANSSGGSIKDFTFTPFVAIPTFYTITVGIDTLTFDLTNLSVDFQSANFLNLSGAGTIHATGFDDTPGTYFLTGQSTAGASPRATFSWSSGTQAEEVPEPASLSLIALGLLATGVMRQRKNKS